MSGLFGSKSKSKELRSADSDLTGGDDDEPSLIQLESPTSTSSGHGSMGSKARSVPNPAKAMGKAARSMGNAVRSTSDSVGNGLRRRKKDSSGGSAPLSFGTKEKKNDEAEVEVSPKGVSFVDQIPEKEPEEKVVEVGPFMEILLRDTTIQIVLSLLLALIPTWKYYGSIMDNEVPLGVSLAWAFVAAALGQELGRVRFSPKPRPSMHERAHAQRPSVAPEDEYYYDDSSSIPSEINVPEGYSFVNRFSRRFSSVRFKFRSQQAPEKKKKKSRIWTSLGRHSSKLTPWENRRKVPVSSSLMDQLKADPHYRRKSLAAIAQEGKEAGADGEEATSWLGTFEADRLDAASMDKTVIVPLFPVRGMDVFLADAGEDSMGEHPFLLKNGLRDRPTLIVNIITQWGNLIIYLALPKWVKDWGASMAEKDDDAEDVRAIKRFVNGDDAYRNARLRLMPCIVQGPMPVRILAPKGKEILIARDYLPVTYKKYDPKTVDGRFLHPCMETELDCQSNKTMRSMAGIVKRYFSSLAIDVAAVIDKPDGSTLEEPKAVISMWRFDKIDLDSCPGMPPRVENADEMSEEGMDVLRATQFAGLTPEQLKEIEVSASS